MFVFNQVQDCFLYVDVFTYLSHLVLVTFNLLMFVVKEKEQSFVLFIHFNIECHIEICSKYFPHVIMSKTHRVKSKVVI